jgi:hypothetical protein
VFGVAAATFTVVVVSRFVGSGQGSVATPTPVAQTHALSSAPASKSGSASATQPVASADVATAAAQTASQSAAQTAAQSAVQAVVYSAPAGGVSVAALDVTTGASFTAGASSSMTEASLVKVQLLETLLLESGRTGTLLSGDEDADATAMIENSDNGAAEDVFWDDGGRDAIVADETDLGLSSAVTVPGTDDYWGLTTTSAAQQLVLLDNLVSTTSPLDASERSYALNLMTNVESDQRWGVGVVADAGSSFANKNGWLGVDDDNGMWAVNSAGIVSVHGHTVLLAVLTQHDDSEQSGIDLVQSLAQSTVAAVGD